MKSTTKNVITRISLIITIAISPGAFAKGGSQSGGKNSSQAEETEEDGQSMTNRYEYQNRNQIQNQNIYKNVMHRAASQGHNNQCQKNKPLA